MNTGHLMALVACAVYTGTSTHASSGQTSLTSKRPSDQRAVQRQRDRDLILAVLHNDTARVQLLLSQAANPNTRDQDFKAITSFDKPALPYAPHPRPAPSVLLLALSYRLVPTGPPPPGGFVGLVVLEPLERRFWHSRRPIPPEAPFRVVRPPENVEIVQMLLDRGADPNAAGILPDSLQTFIATPLQMAVMLNREKTAALLIQRGARVEQSDEEGDTLLMKAAGSGYLGMVACLLAGGARVNHRDHNGDTALTLARGGPAVIEALLKAGADINARNRDGTTALMNAVNCQDTKTVSYLLDKRADLEIKDTNETTALMWAVAAPVKDPKPEIVKLLLDRGASIAGRDREGNTVFDLAKRYPDILQMLQNVRASRH